MVRKTRKQASALAQVDLSQISGQGYSIRGGE